MDTSIWKISLESAGIACWHSIWQITVIWLIFKLLSMLIWRKNNWIYGLAFGAMIVSVMAFVITFTSAWHRADQAIERENAIAVYGPDLIWSPPANQIANPEMSVDYMATFSEKIEHLMGSYAEWIGLIWVISLLYFGLKMLVSYQSIKTIRNQSEPIHTAYIIRLFQSCIRQMGISTPVLLAESKLISEPVTMGWIKPIILFPVGMMAQLPTHQIEALILHELAHIRRHDYLINFLQLGLEAWFFYHPLFRLFAVEMRTRREYACDDLVIRQIQNPLVYAQSLTNVQLSIIHFQNRFIMKSTGHYSFSARIKRIMGIQEPRHFDWKWVLGLAIPLLILFFNVAFKDKAFATPYLPTVLELTFPNTKPDLTGSHTTVSVLNKKQEHPQTSTQTDSLKPNQVAVDPVKMNVIYIGVDNPVNIAVPGLECSKLMVKIQENQAKIKQIEGCTYNITATQTGTITVDVYNTAGEKSMLAGSKVFRVKRIPDPTPLLGGMNNSKTLTHDKFMAHKSVSLILQNFDFDAICEVTGYDLTLLPERGDPVTWSITGNTFSKSFLDQIEALPEKKYAVFLDEIKGKCPGDTNPRNVGGLVFKVKPSE